MQIQPKLKHLQVGVKSIPVDSICAVEVVVIRVLSQTKLQVGSGDCHIAVVELVAVKTCPLTGLAAANTKKRSGCNIIATISSNFVS